MINKLTNARTPRKFFQLSVIYITVRVSAKIKRFSASETSNLDLKNFITIR